MTPQSTFTGSDNSFPLNLSEEDNGTSFHSHRHNKTGLTGHNPWCDDPTINQTWLSLSTNFNYPKDKNQIKESIVRHTITSLARNYFNIDNEAGYQSTSLSVRDQLIINWNRTQMFHTACGTKRLYYLSLEFLMGRTLQNAIINMGIQGTFKEAISELGFKMEDLTEEEKDAALGNGGLGRLAACFMDSLATLDYPAWGYGIRYTYGIFEQKIVNNEQVEFPDYWLTFGNPWEIPRLDIVYEVKFYGNIVKYGDKVKWRAGEIVNAVAYDVPIPGFKTRTCINIRLWSSKPKQIFDLQSFNQGNYQKSVEELQKAENISFVLYPNDNTEAGKELRLKQQYFFVSATLQDIIRRFRKSHHSFNELPNQAAIQLNDTHPTLAIPELLRILVDIEGIDWDEAWSIVQKVFSFTNHTVLPEAQEKWPVEMIQRLLPRHMSIIYDINLFFLQKVEELYPNDRNLLMRLSIIEEGPVQHVRMTHLAVIASHSVNGVAAIHTQLIKETIFKDFVMIDGPKKFQNKTNGITPRRWLHHSNPRLSELISRELRSDLWLANLSQLSKLNELAGNPTFQEEWMKIKYQNKKILAQVIKDRTNVIVDPECLFDVQVKRIHEYKRQFMNILGVIDRYLRILNKEGNVAKRVIIFGGKAAPGYFMAKLVIKLICHVAEVVNQDPRINDKLKVCFLPDYNVSLAEKIIPASDISQHISTAGTEASGTSNMKFALNGGLILGTRDGANIEIGEEIGEDCIFWFGAHKDQVADIRHSFKYRQQMRRIDQRLERVLEAISSGMFGDASSFQPLTDTIGKGGVGDFYLVSHDFPSYLEAQDRIDQVYNYDRAKWAEMSIKSTAGMGKFSSDRCIREYAKEIWNLKPCPIPESIP